MSPLERLPSPSPSFDLSKRFPRLTIHGRRVGFETAEDAATEDQKRLRCVAATCKTLKSSEREHAKSLARRLGQEATPKSLASARYMRHLRRTVIGATLALASQWQRKQLRFITLMSSAWEVSADNLSDFHPRKAMEQLRAQLNRAGAEHADGFLICFLDSEFEPVRRVFVFHVHGLAASGMIKVVEGLKGLEVYTKRAGVHKPHQINRIGKRIERPEVFSYLLKSFWPSKRIGPVGNDGRVKRNRFDSRIPEPEHTRALLWLDRWRLGDFALLVKCRCGSSGITLTAPVDSRAYTRKSATRFRSRT